MVTWVILASIFRVVNFLRAYKSIFLRNLILKSLVSRCHIKTSIKG